MVEAVSAPESSKPHIFHGLAKVGTIQEIKEILLRWCDQSSLFLQVAYFRKLKPW